MKIMDAQEKLDHLLISEYTQRHEACLKLLQILPQEQRDIFMDYFGICIEIHLKLMEFIAEKS